ncbi:glycoside hydrolase family 3 protein [Flagellimonas sp. GZD32]|uniref:glycoside hydrolase family 3 protein n=1 Tax=Flagellimonas cixiensis TaxID=3228750 RepID=UPI0035C8DB66
MKSFKIAVATLATVLLHTACNTNTEKKEPTTPTLEEKIGQMIMVGFRGTSVNQNDAIYKMVKDYHIGGVVLYSRDLPSKETVKRNVESPEQLKKLNADLQAIDSTKLIISIDEEGGFVTRLSVEDGFEYHKSHQAIGELNNTDSTKIWAQNMAAELSSLGINMNFGPVTDININPENPIIGKRERSFSDSVDVVINNSRIFIQEHTQHGIVCVPKHFPGHGSSQNDTHKGLADVTNTWSKKELKPFKALVDDGALNVIMTSHVYNKNLDTLPATLSPKIIDSLLRKDFGFDRVIMSDDMQMRAISNFYDFETSIEKAITAGVDVLLFSNNAAPCPKDEEDCVKIPFDPEIGKRAIDHISKLVKEGKISEERIDESYQRILKLKAGL